MRPTTDVDGAMRFDPSEATLASGAESRPGLVSLIRIWSDRVYFRHQLARMATETPELIDDIGLTMKQVDTEIAKPFWRR